MTTNDQIKANRAKWLEALRSGKYEQGTERLRSKDDTYCCLGVACDALDIENRGRDPVGDMSYGKERNDVTAPEELIEALGLYDRSGKPDPELAFGEVQALTTLNDGLKLPFTQIADILEEGNHWKPLIDSHVYILALEDYDGVIPIEAYENESDAKKAAEEAHIESNSGSYTIIKTVLHTKQNTD